MIRTTPLQESAFLAQSGGLKRSLTSARLVDFDDAAADHSAKFTDDVSFSQENRAPVELHKRTKLIAETEAGITAAVQHAYQQAEGAKQPENFAISWALACHAMQTRHKASLPLHAATLNILRQSHEALEQFAMQPEQQGLLHERSATLIHHSSPRVQAACAALHRNKAAEYRNAQPALFRQRAVIDEQTLIHAASGQPSNTFKSYAKVKFPGFASLKETPLHSTWWKPNS